MYYFASDVHLGAGSAEVRQAVECNFVEWLDRAAADAEAIFLCGDIFDFWFEYKRVVPKGFVRTLGKIAQLTDRGVRVVFMSGNHDMWVLDYLEEECGMELYTTPTTFSLAGRKVHVAHGDNLNVKGDVKLKFLNSFFRSSLARKIFRAVVHPDLALKFGLWWSDISREKHTRQPHDEQERTSLFLREYALEHHAKSGDEVYIFGHLHYAKEYLQERPQIIFMNDWSSDPHYVAIDKNGEAKLLKVND
ncbi:MAG: UDP-2,3-diacylglucosamine diphosphatase [Rikenellaceae bacterium]